MDTENYGKILKEFECKASLKQAIYRNTTEIFEQLKKQLSKTAGRLKHDYGAKDSSVEIDYKENNKFEAQLKFSGDMLMVSMHSNIFNFEPTHSIFQTKYIKDDPYLSYCGIIYIHNFLADSIRYNRLADQGSLIARILINKDKHFMVEGEGALDFLYQDIANNLVTEEKLTDIIERSILFCLDSDLLIPPFAQIKDVTLNQKQSMLAASGFPTGKRLGYQFKAEIEQNNNI
ncbi:hypothetical protein SAMN05421820_102527 [Pedobacter steynii]|uniref:Uncharacterized protein n=1 Tax=Pedobacter steynii TaxID=430522 RepID=A0A1G9P3B8_9SPHI|nr:hypothetical protein [Pedobacter steynii]NQX39105.1 hypothetical protein [Pedobacter steynii]SDL93194.1 hypothetical protein SAMN05421820_102527 [Pedobacter steynii]